MSFDTHWLHFEITHGPQAPGAKEDALFWYKKGQDDTADRETEEEDSRGERDNFNAGYDEGLRDGSNKVLHFVRKFATVGEETDPLTKENLLEFLETLK